jgi:Cu(I)/Ag(I) efflux system protein CusF
MKKASKLLMVLAIAVAMPMAAHAVEGANPAKVSADSGQKGAVGAMSEGEVKKIDKDSGKITIKHGPLVNLDMPGMTMVFRVKDIAMLDQVKAGDKVKFNAEKLNGALTVTAIEVGK